MCLSAGWFSMYLCDAPPLQILMNYCPNLTETIFSPQHACTHPQLPFTGFMMLWSLKLPWSLLHVSFKPHPPQWLRHLYFARMAYFILLLRQHRSLRLILLIFTLLSRLNYGINDLVTQASLSWMPLPNTALASRPTWSHSLIPFVTAQSVQMPVPHAHPWVPPYRPITFDQAHAFTSTSGSCVHRPKTFSSTRPHLESLHLSMSTMLNSLSATLPLATPGWFEPSRRPLPL
jgi:hypothetical protein